MTQIQPLPNGVAFINAASMAEHSVNDKVPRIIDVRRGQSTNPSVSLRSMTLDDLDKPYGQKQLSSMLLWDDAGHDYFEQVLHSTDYYAYRVENELLDSRIHEIASEMHGSGFDDLIELGAGNMEKTVKMLSALATQNATFNYYACDVDFTELERSLKLLITRLPETCRNFNLLGVCGTYEDVAYWINSDTIMSKRRKALMWLGNSIANFSAVKASQLLGAFVGGQNVTTVAGFLITVDGCQDEGVIERAYNNLPTTKWMANAMQTAKSLLGPDAAELLRGSEWDLEAIWDRQEHFYWHCFRALKSISAIVDDRSISVCEGERIRVDSRSSKWSKDEVTEICAKQGLDIGRWWNSPKVDYGIYWLQMKQSA